MNLVINGKSCTVADDDAMLIDVAPLPMTTRC